MDVSFSIDMKNAWVRNISAFLAGLVVVRDGLELVINGDTSKLFSTINGEVEVRSKESTLNTRNSYEQFLQHVGELFVKHNHQWSIPPQTVIDVISQAILTNRPSDDIRLLSLRRNGLDGVIEELGGAVGELFRRLFGATRYIVNGEIGPEIEKLLEELEVLSTQAAHTRRRGLGIIIIGIEMLKRTYIQEGVTNVEVGSRT
jgi:hypothetical protein